MTFPVIAASNTSSQPTNSTSHTVNLPASISSGEVLLVTIILDNRPTVTGNLPDNWTELTADSPGNDSVRIQCYFRRATGAEGGTVTFTTSAAQCSAHKSYRITGAHDSTNPFAAGNNAADSATSLNPAATNPSTWDVEDTLWVVFSGNDNGTITITGFPTSYTDTGQLAGGNAADGVNIGWAVRNNAVASEDPSAFTYSSAAGCVTAVVAIRPTAVLPPITPTVITPVATAYQPFVQNMTLQPTTISAFAEFIGHEPSVVLVVTPASISSTVTLYQPTVANIGTQQNINPITIDASVTTNSLIGVFLVGPITPPALSVPATLFQPLVGTNVIPSTITVTTTVHSPTILLSIQYIDLDRIVAGMFVFSPNIQAASGMAGLRATVRDLPKTSSVGDVDFKASVTTPAKIATVNETHTATFREA